MCKRRYTSVSADARGRIGAAGVLHPAWLVVLAVIVSLLACGQHSDWVEFRGDGGRGHTRNAMNPPLGLRWEFALQSDQEAFAFNNLVVKDETLYFGSTDGNFYAMNIETGYMDWVYRTDGAVNSVPFVDEERVYFGSNDGHLYAVDRETGEEAWTHRAGRAVQSTVIKHDDKIVFGVDGRGVTFLSTEGDVLNRIENPIWLRVSLQVDEDLLYVVPGPPENPRSLGVYDIDAQRHTWLLPEELMAASWYSFPAVNDRRLFTQTSRISDGEMQYSAWALDRRDGSVEWRRELTADFAGDPPQNLGGYFQELTNILDFQAPALWRDRVISASGDNTLRAFEEESGSIAWETSLANRTSSAPMTSGDVVFVGLHGDASGRTPSPSAGDASGRTPSPSAGDESASGRQGETESRSPRLAAFSARSGRLIWEFETEGAVLSPPVVAGRYMVFGTDANVVYVLERVLG
ncbi:MAG: PQQ-binding-like beta-propeller repeat protein [Spirochaetales bacterium]